MVKRLLLLLVICFLAGCSPEKIVVKTDNIQLPRDYKIHNEIIPVNPGVFPENQPWQTINANLRRKVFFNDRQTMVLYEAAKTDTGKDVNTQYHYHELSGYVLSGNLLIRIDKKVQSMGPGGVYIVPSNVHYAVLPLTGKVSYLEIFTPTRDDLRSPPILLRFDENDVKSVIYKWYAYLDKLADVNNYLPLLANRGLVMHIPGAVIRTQEDFKTWYAGMLKKTKTNTSIVKNVVVTIDENGNFIAEFNVSWEALTSLDEKRNYNSRQKWTLVDQGGVTPVILGTDYKEISNIMP
ncbi:MAG: hypothetical protein NTZ24_11115 [Deltaproteobacteria bacterium]|nr:hypothetical protein [Deltaproteobacteria bacterium]